MSNIPLQGLERGNFTPGSTEKESTRRVNVSNTTDEPIPVIRDANQQSIEQNNILSALSDITYQLKKMNYYLEKITEEKATHADICD